MPTPTPERAAELLRSVRLMVDNDLSDKEISERLKLTNYSTIDYVMGFRLAIQTESKPKDHK